MRQGIHTVCLVIGCGWGQLALSNGGKAVFGT